jgi:high-affinity nickel-transport protein
MIGATTAAVSLGLLVGARHAFEPDHLAAVSTLVTSTRNARGAALLGLVWGVGHTLALLAVGIALVLVDGALPARVGAAFELAVAAMLVLLGARAVILGIRNRHGDPAPHRHGGLEHAHGGAGEHVHLGARAVAWRPLTIGIVHGLAGSGALTALAFAQLPTSSARILYMIVFGTGSVAGMAIATGLAGVALQRVARGPTARRWLAIATGLVSCAVGISWTVG